MTDFEALRREEFSRLDAGDHVYLDYTGSSLYPESLVRRHARMLNRSVLGNPHSHSPSSTAAEKQVNATRAAVLRFFNADPAEYEVIFTCNATAALKLVGESYPFQTGSVLLMTSDNHNSVNGLREFATRRGAEIRYARINQQLQIDGFEEVLGEPHGEASLFCYPAQSNFSGVKHPPGWIRDALNAGYDVFLDAAAFVPTNRLDLSEVKPSYVCVSFYKMFGYPTGIGALLARRDALVRLRRPWFGGGTVEYAPVERDGPLKEVTAAAFEDGTINFLSICAVASGLSFLDDVGMDDLNAHVMSLTAYFLDRLEQLVHENGRPAACIYGPRTLESRGATVAFNLVEPDGSIVDCKRVEERCAGRNISLRTGGFCNPGASEIALNYTEPGTFEQFEHLCPDDFAEQQATECSIERPTGAVRVSFGLASHRRDVDRLMDVLASFSNQRRLKEGAPLSA